MEIIILLIIAGVILYLWNNNSKLYKRINELEEVTPNPTEDKSITKGQKKAIEIEIERLLQEDTMEALAKQLDVSIGIVARLKHIHKTPMKATTADKYIKKLRAIK